MKRNTIIKVMSASILAASLAVVDFPTNLQQTKYIHAVGTQEVSVDVAAHLLNANNSGQLSMGDTALEKVSIKKVGNQYQYTIIWKDIEIGKQSDGISKFWVEGKEVPLTSITYPNVTNPKQAVFTLPELKSTLNVEVFVQTMENISQGAGRKPVILQLDINGVAEQLETSTTEKQSTTTDNSVQENKTTKQAETDNSAKADASQSSAAKAAKEKAEADRTAKENTTNTNNNTSGVDNSTSSTHYSGFRSANRNTANRTSNTSSNPVTSSPQGTTRSVPAGNSTGNSGAVSSGNTRPSPAQANNSSQTSPAQAGNQDEEVTFFDDVSVSLLNASNPNQKSMGDAALDGITIYKDSKNTYHYIVNFHNITVGQSSDGISRFWVNGTEYPVTSTNGPNNQVQVHFTSNEKLHQVPVSVFVQTMENIMPGAGKKDAILSLDWSGAKERKGTAPKDPNGGPANGPANGPAGNNTGNNTSGRVNNSGKLSKTGLDNTYTVLIGAVVLVGVVLVITRRKQN